MTDSPNWRIAPLQLLQSFYSVHSYHIYIYIFIHLVVCLTTGSKPLPKPALHIVRSRASSFKWEHPLLSLRSSNSFLRLLPCLLVTSIPPCIFPSVTRCRRQFRRKMWPIQFAFRLRISCRIFLCSLTLIKEVLMFEYLTPCSWLQSTVRWRLSFVQNNNISELTERIRKLWRTPVFSSLFSNSVPSSPEHSQRNWSVGETVSLRSKRVGSEVIWWYSGAHLSKWRLKHIWKLHWLRCSVY